LNEETSRNFIRLIKSEIRRAGNIARTDHVTNVYKNFNQTRRGKSLLGDKTWCQVLDWVTHGGNVVHRQLWATS